MRKLISIVVALAVALSLAVPAMAQEVTTTVTVNGGTTAAPIIKAKWEQDLTTSLEDGDPSHATPGTQLLPPLSKGGKKLLQYWAVVTDPDGMANVDTVMVDVFHPAGPPLDGSFKYQLILSKVDTTLGTAAYSAAENAGLVTYQQNTVPPINDADILFELDKGTAWVYMVQGELDYEQPAGDYTAIFDAFDKSNVWASQATPPTNLSNEFTYIGVAGIELDFNSFSYGSVSVNSEKWIAGNTVWNSPVAAAPGPNPATVRSIGNVLVQITVQNTDMGFGFNGPTGTATAYSGSVAPTSAQTNWNVGFAARMGSNQANAMYFDPGVTVTLPNVLQLSSQDELDFAIKVTKATAGVRSGTMFIGAVIVPF
jgi:hypothetical protein